MISGFTVAVTLIVFSIGISGIGFACVSGLDEILEYGHE